MLLKIIHQTDLSYSDTIAESVMELRVTPRQEAGQRRLGFHLAIGPQANVSSHLDWLGNIVHAFTVSAPHDEIKIVATSVVETHPATLDPRDLPDAWPLDGQVDWRMYDYLEFDGPVVNAPLLGRLVEQIKPAAGESLGGLAMRVLEMIGNKFYYRRGITTAASPITEMLEHGQGVCQDFTHLLIALARAMKVPARYVSGLLHPQADKLKGHTQTHAWCELFFPSAGWVGFDPANHCVVGEHFVKVAVGRDFRDVPPNRGVYRGSAHESIDVRVRSNELEAIPPELAAAERVQVLPMPPHAHAAVPRRELLQQQQDQQQQ
jgi:transglutaminase-like putative cysteine protease